MFINDLPEVLDLFCQLFADDCTLQAEGKSIDELILKVTEELAKAEQWFRANKLTLNLKKTKFAVFGNDQSILKNIPDLTINGTPIERIGKDQREKVVRFLGLWVSDDSNFTQHIDKLKSKINTGLYHLAISKENAPLRIRLSMYRALVESQLRFGNISFCSEIGRVVYIAKESHQTCHELLL